MWMSCLNFDKIFYSDRFYLMMLQIKGYLFSKLNVYITAKYKLENKIYFLHCKKVFNYSLMVLLHYKSFLVLFFNQYCTTIIVCAVHFTFFIVFVY